MILNTRGETSAVYKDSNIAMPRKIPKETTGLPKNKNINLIIILFKIAITHISMARLKLLSMDIFLDTFKIAILHKVNTKVFIPKLLA